MNPFGDGSDGALNVTSGTTTLLLNRKYQFTNINIAAGATLTIPSNTTGSVLYLLANGTVNIEGTINVSNRVQHGNNSWPVTIDGVEYTSPGVQNGGNGGAYTGQSTAFQSNGFGGGGSGSTVSINGTSYRAGNGGNGSGLNPNGGAASNITRNSSGVSSGRNNGSNGGGGSGLSYVSMTINSGSGYVRSYSGAGGSGWGVNGGDGSGVVSSGWSGTYEFYAGGGGGSGGRAGRAGVNVVIKSPTVNITGTIITSGTAGGEGGSGGRARTHNGFTDFWGSGGGGGGGGNAGFLQVYYANNAVDESIVELNGGSGGLGGLGGAANFFRAASGSDGFTSSYSFNQIPPYSNFTSNVTNGGRPLTVNFTNQSVGADSYIWDFGDGTTSTAINPIKTYSSIGTYTVSLTAINEAGETIETKSSYITTTIAEYDLSITARFTIGGGLSRTYIANRTISGGFTMGGDVSAIRRGETASIQRKTYLYKIYDEDGNFQGILDDVISPLSFTKEINTPGSSVELELARNSDSRETQRENRTIVGGQTRTDVLNALRTVTTRSKAKVGPGSNLVHNNRVDVWIYYGSTRNRTTVMGRDRTTVSGDDRTVSVGFPNGKIKYSGFISQINTRYGSTETTNVSLLSYGYDLDQYLYDTTSGSTTIAQNSLDPSQMIRNGLNRFADVGIGTYTTYSDTTIDTTSSVASYTFKANTYLEVIEKALELSPSDWYYHVDLGSNEVNFHERSVTPNHIFLLGVHIESLNLRSSIEDTINDVLFTGGETIEGDPTSVLYRRYTREPAQYTRRGLERMNDGRVTLTSSADILSEGRISENNKVQYKSSITILDGTYDIEEIEVGDTIGFRNFGNFVDGLVMQVVGLTYNPESVTLQLDTLSPAVPKRLQDLRRNQENTATTDVPNNPVNV